MVMLDYGVVLDGPFLYRERKEVLYGSTDLLNCIWYTKYFERRHCRPFGKLPSEDFKLVCNDIAQK